jgi:hypothetical protein
MPVGEAGQGKKKAGSVDLVQPEVSGVRFTKGTRQPLEGLSYGSWGRSSGSVDVGISVDVSDC